jgi:hypothetical protein
MTDEELIEQQIAAAIALLRVGAALGDSRCRHGIKVLTSNDLPAQTRTEMAEVYYDRPGRPAIDDAKRVETAMRIGKRGAATAVARSSPESILLRSVARRIQRKMRDYAT